MRVMRQRWLHLLFLHWTAPAAALQRLLPAGLEVDVHEGRAYVSLVPFTIRGVRPPLSFHEVNLRTYVRCAGGPPGVWFFSLDAASRLAVLGARAWYRLPYHHARMRMTCVPWQAWGGSIISKRDQLRSSILSMLSPGSTS